ncbi:MAG: hypothetical protein ACJ8GK_00690 [Luteimonas sp.]
MHLAKDHALAPVAFPRDVPESGVQIDSWQSLSLNEKLRRSSAVVIADIKVSDGKATAIATDVIVRNPETVVLYKVGQEVPVLSREASGFTDWGDGAVALLEGSPASMRESYSVLGGRIPGLGDMPVQKFEEMAHAR